MQAFTAIIMGEFACVVPYFFIVKISPRIISLNSIQISNTEHPRGQL